ncbi:MAG: winged helix-turn-helix domain-containing protein [Candidatus Omnitrophota bacterium]|nr:MAG: winged helix-turn-helix domain-containing protein [Candidatus Omnitrophota bacterium]
MFTEIGIVAGEIWHFLDSHGEVSLLQLLKGIEKPKEVILMSLGWLAREGHVLVKFEEDQYKVNLRGESS